MSVLQQQQDEKSQAAQNLENVHKQDFPVLEFGARFSEVAEHWCMTNDISFVNFRQKLWSVSENRRRSNHLFGRVYNFLTGSDTRFVMLSRAVLQDAYRVSGQMFPDKYSRQGYHNVHYDEAETLFNKFYESLKKHPEYKAQKEKTVKR